MDWQPIETAPKDGTEVILYCPFPNYPLVTCGEFFCGDWAFVGSLDYIDHQPNHWMPLPEPPTT